MLYLGVSLLLFLVSVWRRGTYFAGIGVSVAIWEMVQLAINNGGNPIIDIANGDTTSGIDFIMLFALIVVLQLGWLIMVRQQQSELP